MRAAGVEAFNMWIWRESAGWSKWVLAEIQCIPKLIQILIMRAAGVPLICGYGESQLDGANGF